MNSSNKSDPTPSGEEEQEYRIFGCTHSGYRVTDWGSEERAEEVYREADWAMLSIERRVDADNKTIHRKPTPDSDDWVHVTDDMTHLADEEVATA